MPADLSASGEDRMRDVTFSSGGAALGAWLYEPDTPPPWPLVVMAHGFSAPLVSCPSLVLAPPHDEMPRACPPVTRNVFDQLRGPKQLVEIDGGHFGLLYYPSAELDHASSVQARFASEQLVKRS